MRNVFLVNNGTDVLNFLSEADMNAAGYAEADKIVSEEEFNSNGCYVRVIGGEIVVGKTEKERQIQALSDQISEIDEQLAALDNKYLTPRILGGIPSGDTFAVDARTKHELAAIPLRGERETLKEQLDALMT